MSRAARSRGVALVNALVVVAALAAISAALLIRTERALERQGLRNQTDQLAAFLDAGQDQALAELARLLDARTDAVTRPGQGWDRPRQVPIDRGALSWAFTDLQGRFNLGWLADEGAVGDLAREAFARLAEELELPQALTARLIRAAGPDRLARASALDLPRGPELPLVLAQQLAGAARPADGGAAALAPLWPLVAALPPRAGLNPETAPLPVLRAFLPGIDAEDWLAFETLRAAGGLAAIGGLQGFAAQHGAEGAVAMLQLLPQDMDSDWFELRLTAQLDSRSLARSAVVALRPDPDAPRPQQAAPRVVLALPVAVDPAIPAPSPSAASAPAVTE